MSQNKVQKGGIIMPKNLPVIRHFCILDDPRFLKWLVKYINKSKKIKRNVNEPTT